MMNGYKLKIVWMYHDIMDLYGDKGNMMVLQRRCEQRGIDVGIDTCGIGESCDLASYDLIFLGGGADREQMMLIDDLLSRRENIREAMEQGTFVLLICGGYQLLGNYYKMGDETIEGLGVVNIHTERGDSRLISNIVLQSDLFPLPIVGFENHGGRTFIEDYQPLGKVLSGHGNNDKDKGEGIVYKNVIGTYLHGPLLPKNPHLCDYLLQTALNRRFGKVDLPELDDKDELAANHYIVKRFAQSE